MASKSNEFPGKHILRRIYYDDEIVPRDIIKSIYFFDLSSSQNCISSFIRLGLIYLEGKIC